MLKVNGSLTLLLGSSYDYQLISGSALALLGLGAMGLVARRRRTA